MTRTGALPAIAAGLAAALFASAAEAQLAVQNSKEPIDITGDRLEVENEVATWAGHVRAVQGEAILTADRLVADLDKDGTFKKIHALGTVRYSNGKEAITGDKGVFDDKTRTIVVTGNVIVTQGEQIMTGGALTYWVDTGKIVFTAPAGRRIRGVFHPKQGAGNS